MIVRPKFILVVISTTIVILCGAAQRFAFADVSMYEADRDPGVGFNLVSWANFGATGNSVWENAVQSVHDAGFGEVSLSPVRFYTPGVGSIAATSSQGPELSHVAAGIARAKQLGMRVTVNPFVEPVGFSTWRGFYNPAPGSGESTQFWNDYQQYLADVAVMAEANGADAMTVGTELRALTRNAGNNANWSAVIEAVNIEFSGDIGYAANWDNYNHSNVAAALWDNPAIDFLGIDSYFQGLLSNSQADASGSYPNASFISQVESAWNGRLDNEILPYAQARQSGTGLPVKFTEVGYLPYNRTIVQPQNSGGTLDRDEQNMAFEGLMRALDGRLASGKFLAAHIWQWNMPGSNGSLWNMDPNGGNQPNNQQTAKWLSSFVSGENSGGDPSDPPVGATEVLYSFEDGLQGFFYPNFETQPASMLAIANGTGVTDGTKSLAITKPTSPWTWDARVSMAGDQLRLLQDALTDNIDDYVLEIDVTYVSENLPANLSSIDMHVSFESNLDNWSQDWPLAAVSEPVDQKVTVEIPLNNFDLTPGLSSANFHIGFAGSWVGDATVYIDRIALTDTSFVAPGNADFDADDDVDGADYRTWQRGRGLLGGDASQSDGDANGDQLVDERDLSIWHTQYSMGAQSLAQATQVPEPAAMIQTLVAICVFARPISAEPRL